MNLETVNLINEKAQELETLTEALQKQFAFLEQTKDQKKIQEWINRDREAIVKIKRGIEECATEIANKIINQKQRGYLYND